MELNFVDVSEAANQTSTGLLSLSPILEEEPVPGPSSRDPQQLPFSTGNSNAYWNVNEDPEEASPSGMGGIGPTVGNATQQIKLNNFPTVLFEDTLLVNRTELRNHLTNFGETPTNVELISFDGSKVKAHGRLLIFFCPSFFDFFVGQNPIQNGEHQAFVVDIDGVILREIVHYLYFGKIIITVENALRMLRASRKMHLWTLERKCEDLLCLGINKYNVDLLNVFAKGLGLRVLETATYSFGLNSSSQTNLSSLYKHKAIENFTYNDMLDYLTSRPKSRSEEEEQIVFSNVLDWANKDIQSRQTYFGILIDLIDLFKLPAPYFLAQFRINPALVGNSKCQDIYIEFLENMVKQCTASIRNGSIPGGNCPEVDTEAELSESDDERSQQPPTQPPGTQVPLPNGSHPHNTRKRFLRPVQHAEEKQKRKPRKPRSTQKQDDTAGACALTAATAENVIMTAATKTRRRKKGDSGAIVIKRTRKRASRKNCSGNKDVVHGKSQKLQLVDIQTCGAVMKEEDRKTNACNFSCIESAVTSSIKVNIDGEWL